MSKIETGRYSELLRKQLGQKGQELVASELSPEISPTIQLEAAFPSLEWYYLKGVRAIGVGGDVRPNVAAGGHIRLTNPSDSGVIAIVTRIGLQGNALIEWVVNIQEDTVPLASTGLPAARDGRWPRTAAINQSALSLTFTAASGAVGTGAGTLHRAVVLAFVFVEYTDQVVLPPGWSLDWGSISVNINVNFSAAWFERPVAALELS